MEQTFSDRLKRYRKAKNLTQQELADALGVSNKSVSRWESEGGYPDIPLLVPLAGLAVVAGFWCVYTLPRLPAWCWRYQGALFAALLVVLAALCGLALGRKKAWRALVGGWVVLLASTAVWPLRQLRQVQSLSSGELYAWTENIRMEYYLGLWRPSPALFAVLGLLAALYLAVAGIQKK